MNKNIITHSDSTNSFNLTQLSTETGNSVFNSLNNSIRNSANSFIEENLYYSKPNIEKIYYRNEDEQFCHDINVAFQNIAKMAFESGKGNFNSCNYYCNYFLKKNNF